MNFIIWTCYNVQIGLVRPAGAHQIASWLRSHGYSVKVIDFCHVLTTEQLVNLTEKYITKDTIAIGASSNFWIHNLDRFNKFKYKEPQWLIDAREILQVKHSKLDWVLGGTNSIIWDNSRFKFDWVIMHGMAEDKILKWFDEKTKSNFIRKPFEIQTLTGKHTEQDSIKPHEWLTIELSRGCHFKCSFCRFPSLGKKKNSYLRTYDYIEAELRENYDKFGTTKYFVMDDTTNESLEKITALANIAQRLPFKFEWVGYNRMDLVYANKSTIQILKDSGLTSSFFGIETFNKDASKVIGKGWSGVHGKEFVQELKSIWKQDITFHLSFIVGLPGETREDLWETVQFCIDNDVDAWRFHHLNINKNPELVWQSEFDLNYVKHGYRFPDPLDHTLWENNLWNRNTAWEETQKLMKTTSEYVRPAQYLLGEICSLGYDTSYMKSIKQKDLPKEELTAKLVNHANLYYNEQINMPN